MDKYEYRLKTEQIQKLSKEGKTDEAIALADSIPWNKVRDTRMLSFVSKLYERFGRFEDAADCLLQALEYSPVGRRVLYQLTELYVKSGDIEKAEESFQEFCDTAPNDGSVSLLRYQIQKAKNDTPQHLIEILEEYGRREFDERWSYELARLYAKAGRVDDAVKLCDTIILWFGLGPYVEKAEELRNQLRPEEARERREREPFDEEIPKEEAPIPEESAAGEESPALPEEDPGLETEVRAESGLPAEEGVREEAESREEAHEVSGDSYTRELVFDSHQDMTRYITSLAKKMREKEEQKDILREARNEEFPEKEEHSMYEETEEEILPAEGEDDHVQERHMDPVHSDLTEDDFEEEESSLPEPGESSLPEMEELDLPETEEPEEYHPEGRLLRRSDDIEPEEAREKETEVYEERVRLSLPAEPSAAPDTQLPGDEFLDPVTEEEVVLLNGEEETRGGELPPEENMETGEESIFVETGDRLRRKTEDVQIQEEEEPQKDEAPEVLPEDKTPEVRMPERETEMTESETEEEEGDMAEPGMTNLPKTVPQPDPSLLDGGQSRKHFVPAAVLYGANTLREEKERRIRLAEEHRRNLLRKKNEIEQGSLPEGVKKLLLQQLGTEEWKPGNTEPVYREVMKDLSAEDFRTDEFEEESDLSAELKESLIQDLMSDEEYEYHETEEPAARKEEKEEAVAAEQPAESAEVSAESVREEAVEDKAEEEKPEEKQENQENREEKLTAEGTLPDAAVLKEDLDLIRHFRVVAEEEEVGLEYILQKLKLMRKGAKKRPKTVTKSSGEYMNRNGVLNVASRLKDRILIVRSAGHLSEESLDEFVKLLHSDREDLMVVFLDTPEGMRALDERYPSLQNFCDATYTAVNFTSDRLMDFACDYLEKKNCILDDKAMMLLYEIAEEMIEDPEIQEDREMALFLDEVIEHASKKGAAKAFRALFQNRYDGEGRLIIRKGDIE